MTHIHSLSTHGHRYFYGPPCRRPITDAPCLSAHRLLASYHVHFPTTFKVERSKVKFTHSDTKVLSEHKVVRWGQRWIPRPSWRGNLSFLIAQFHSSTSTILPNDPPLPYYRVALFLSASLPSVKVISRLFIEATPV